MELYNYETCQMTKYIKERCNNYKDDQKSMINSIMERKIRHITIDKVYKNKDGKEFLYTNSKDIKRETNEHFQTVAGATNTDKIIDKNNFWYEQYKEKEYINNDIYNHLMDEPTWDEWIETVKLLPNGKAAGLSKISYEMIKYLSDDYQEIIYNFICACIKMNNIPDAWRKATVYLIPKPKPFNSDLNNTRPITLLETMRKAMVALLNQRFTHILKDNNVLKGNQFAGLPTNSTFELIRIINEIIQDVTEKNKELWLLSQDLGKAYDRVNIYMLKRALRRINLPPLFISFIKHLFLHRTNQVFTSYGLTDKYEVKIGIDQGEIISPLLWCIYYDPLLTEVEQSNLGYTIQQRYKKNIFDCIFQSKSFSTASVAFMDDTQWLSNSQSNLEKILTIADSFYKLNDIQVNKDKSELLVRKIKKKHRKKKYRNYNSLKDFEFMDNVILTDEPPFNYNAELSLKFGEKLADDGTICPDSILIKPKLPNESI